MMTSKAKEIGMENTNFANSSGINNTENVSTVRDIMIMSNYLIKNFLKNINIFQKKNLPGIEQEVIQLHRVIEIPPLLYKNFGADGIKTGYLAVEKYSLASSVYRKGRRLIAVGSGFKTKN